MDDGAEAISAHVEAAIPGYEIGLLLHRGGQGAVYRARQVSTGRTVAVKTLRHGPLASPRERARFEREAQVLSRLKHPGIVSILDVGVVGGSQFCVMEFVEGAPVDTYLAARGVGCGDQRWRGAEISRDAAVALVAATAEAVHAAHLCGVIHRDLKPANVLVDEHDRVRLIDFGLAWIEQEGPSGISAEGEFTGSLPWSAPEQTIRGAMIDVRSDVYSIGVILYQVMTGVMPYSLGSSVVEAVATIQNSRPAPPRSIVPDTPRDLETIALRCLAKEPERRYQSAGALAGDLRRFLASEPIEARSDSMRYLVHHLMRRHRAAVATVLLATIAAIAGLIVMTSLWRTAGTARTQAIAQANRAAAVSSFVASMLRSANPAAASDPGAPDATIRSALDDAASLLDARDLADQPDAEAAVRTLLGDAYVAIGRLEAGDSQLALAIELLIKVAPGSPELAHAYAKRALALNGLGEYEASVREARKAWAIAQSSDAAPVSDRVVWADALARTLLGAGRAAEAAEIQREALAIYKVSTESERITLAEPLARLVIMQHGGSDAEESIALLRDAIAISQAAGRGARIETMNLHHALGAVLMLRNRAEEAERELVIGAEGIARIYGESHPWLARVLTDLTFLYQMNGNTDRAVDVTARLVACAREAYSPSSDLLADALKLQARAAFSARDEVTYVSACEEAIAILAANGSDPDPGIASMRVNVASIAMRRGEVERASAHVDAVLAMPPEKIPQASLQHGEALSLRGAILTLRGDFASAEAPLLRGREIIMACGAPGALRAQAAQRLARLYEAWHTAEPDVERAAKAADWKSAAESQLPP